MPPWRTDEGRWDSGHGLEVAADSGANCAAKASYSLQEHGEDVAHGRAGGMDVWRRSRVLYRDQGCLLSLDHVSAESSSGSRVDGGERSTAAQSRAAQQRTAAAAMSVAAGYRELRESALAVSSNSSSSGLHIQQSTEHTQ